MCLIKRCKYFVTGIIAIIQHTIHRLKRRSPESKRYDFAGPGPAQASLIWFYVTIPTLRNVDAHMTDYLSERKFEKIEEIFRHLSP